MLPAYHKCQKTVMGQFVKKHDNPVIVGESFDTLCFLLVLLQNKPS
jgi:hypothetical protein